LSPTRTIENPARTAEEQRVIEAIVAAGRFDNVGDMLRTAAWCFGRQQFGMKIPAHILCTGPARRRP
jgi:hypothetical protein